VKWREANSTLYSSLAFLQKRRNGKARIPSLLVVRTSNVAIRDEMAPALTLYRLPLRNYYTNCIESRQPGLYPRCQSPGSRSLTYLPPKPQFQWHGPDKIVRLSSLPELKNHVQFQWEGLTLFPSPPNVLRWARGNRYVWQAGWENWKPG